MTAVSRAICPDCGSAAAPGAGTCAVCGGPLPPEATHCPRCGDTLRWLRAGFSRPLATQRSSAGNVKGWAQLGTFAAEQAAAVAQRCEAVIAAANAVIGIAAPATPVVVRLVEALPQPATVDAPSSAIAPDRGEVRAVFRPDAPGVDLERALLRLLLLRSGGVQRDPAAAPLLLDGLLGVLAQQGGCMQTPEQLAALLTQAANAGMAVAAAPLFEGPPSAPLYQQIATSLVYLRPYRWLEAEIIFYILIGIGFGQTLPTASTCWTAAGWSSRARTPSCWRRAGATRGCTRSRAAARRSHRRWRRCGVCPRSPRSTARSWPRSPRSQRRCA